jgi:FlaA1/EpsC-like NDP-sugar epimerase
MSMKMPQKEISKDNFNTGRRRGPSFPGRSQIFTMALVLYDIAAVNGSYFAALWLRFDLRFSMIPEYYLQPFLKFAPFYTAACLLIFHYFKLYRSVWRFASYNELVRVFGGNAVSAVFHTLAITVFFGRMPISYYIFGAILQFGAMAAARFSYRLVLLERRIRASAGSQAPRHNIMLIGAGNAGQIILRDIRMAKETDGKVCCIIDDNPGKRNRYIDGVPIVGGRDEILSSVEKYKIDKIYFAIPSASAVDKREILNICKETNCEIKTLPGLYQLINGDVSVSALKKVAIEDLLGRDQINVDLSEITGYLAGKVVLVTGGGGSIGSELVRQVAASGPARLIIFDVYENNAYEIQQEIRRKNPELDLVTLIGSVRDSKKVMDVFARYQPQIVFHAAAHKHVPLMEDSPCESIKNNAIGTYKTAYAAMYYGCERFVLISTDKAVNPTNIMGASKRLCEMVIQTFAEMISQGREKELPLLHAHLWDEEGFSGQMPGPRFHSHTRFVAVRFGNVLGSNGSVIPLFKKQIEAGGPVTVTHPDIIRYFMTIPEAVSLVLQAGYYGEGGNIYVLDMGEPVKIDTLARNLIRLSGLKPDIDIKIVYTGLRPGEKLFEEKLMAEEGLRKTPNDLIYIGNPVPFNVDHFLVQLKNLMDAACDNREKDIRAMVRQIVVTYRPAGSHGSSYKNKAYEMFIREKKEEADSEGS